MYTPEQIRAAGISGEINSIDVEHLINILEESKGRPLKEMSAEDLMQIVIIEGCCPALEFWNEPELTEFDNRMFSDTLVVDYVSYRIEDGLKSAEYRFFFNFKDFRFHYTKDYEQNKNQPLNSNRIRLETLRYLIKQGYDIPVFNQ